MKNLLLLAALFCVGCGERPSPGPVEVGEGKGIRMRPATGFGTVGGGDVQPGRR